jgi:hypothetical protein
VLRRQETPEPEPPEQDTLTALSPAEVWVGVKNSDAVGLRLDLKAEMYLNATKVGEGQLINVASGSSGFTNARPHAIPLTLLTAAEVPADVELELTLSVRRTCVGWQTLEYHTTFICAAFNFPGKTPPGNTLALLRSVCFAPLSDCAGQCPRRTPHPDRAEPGVCDTKRPQRVSCLPRPGDLWG